MDDTLGIVISVLALAIPCACAVYAYQRFRAHSLVLGLLVALPTFLVVLVGVMFGGLLLFGDY